jgi:hypothetical protein
LQSDGIDISTLADGESAFLAMGSCRGLQEGRFQVLEWLVSQCGLKITKKNRDATAKLMQGLWQLAPDQNEPAMAYFVSSYISSSYLISKKDLPGVRPHIEFKRDSVRHLEPGFESEESCYPFDSNGPVFDKRPPIPICLGDWEFVLPEAGETSKRLAYHCFSNIRSLIGVPDESYGAGMCSVVTLIPASADDGRMMDRVAQGREAYRPHQTIRQYREMLEMDELPLPFSSCLHVQLLMLFRFHDRGEGMTPLLNQANVTFHPEDVSNNGSREDRTGKVFDINLHERDFRYLALHYVGLQEMLKAFASGAIG